MSMRVFTTIYAVIFVVMTVLLVLSVLGFFTDPLINPGM